MGTADSCIKNNHFPYILKYLMLILPNYSSIGIYVLSLVFSTAVWPYKEGHFKIWIYIARECVSTKVEINMWRAF